MPPPNTKGQMRRVARQTREAALHATPQELINVTNLTLRLRQGTINAAQAREELRTILREQNKRNSTTTHTALLQDTA